LGTVTLLFTLPTPGAPGAERGRPQTSSVANTTPGRLKPLDPRPSLTFEPNRGQTEPSIDFIGRGPGFVLELGGGDALLRFPETASSVRMRLVGTAGEPIAPTGLEPLEKRSHYLLGSDRQRWITGVPNFASVLYAQVYPGVDLVYHGTPGQLEFDFHVAPGADPGRIRLQLTGGNLSLDASGDLVLTLAAGRLVLRRPVVYQEEDRVRRPIEGRYVVIGREKVAFSLGRYDRRLPLVIDPVVSYSSYIGGSGSDLVYASATDAAGDLYLAGATASADLEAGDRKPSGKLDAWVCKLTPGAAAAEYCAVIGGAEDDIARGIAVDGDGQAYVTGATRSADFPALGALQAGFAGGSEDGDAFVLKLDAAGLPAFSTYLGGANADGGRAIAVDSTGVYVAGLTNSADFPLTNPLQQRLAGGFDGFVAKLGLAGAFVEYSTFLGGSQQDVVNGLGLGADSSVYAVGQTNSPDLATVKAVQPAYAGAPGCRAAAFCGDGFVAKLTSDGATLEFATYLGGGDDDGTVGVSVQGRRVFVAGFTRSTDFPTTRGAAQGSLRGGYDAHVTQFGADGSLFASTYLGGSGRDVPRGIVATRSGDAYIVGVTASADYPVSADAIQPVLGGERDAFVTRIAPGGAALGYSSYVGGTGDDAGYAVSLLGDSSIAVSGSTTSGDFSVHRALRVARGGASEGFFVILEGMPRFPAGEGANASGGVGLSLPPSSIEVTPDPPLTSGLAVFAADCVTPKSDFVGGETACVQVSHVLAPSGPRRLNWVSPSGVVPRVADITSNPQTDSFALPLSIGDLGKWTVTELDLGNDTVRTSVTIIVHDANLSFANLGIHKALIPQELVVGATLSSYLFVWNNGPDAASDVLITDNTPASATLLSVRQASGPAFSCSSSAGATTCTAPRLALNATAVFAIDYQLNSASNVVNQASVSSATAETNVADDGSTATATVPGGEGGGGGGGSCSLTCPNDITRNNDPGQAGALVSYADPASSDSCGVVSCDPASGSFFPLGPTQVACSSAGAEQSCSFLVTVNDPQAITITLLGDNPLTVECHGTFTDPGATAQNGLGQTFPVTASLSSDPDERLDVNRPGSYTITYTATDGTETAVAARTVIVVDTAAPAITLNGANPLIVECSANFSDPGATAFDACAGSVAVDASGAPDVSTPGSYSIVYSAADSSGNEAAPVTRTLDVVDRTAPVITLDASPLILWQPDQTMASFDVASLVLAAGDVCDAGAGAAGVVIAEVSSDEQTGDDEDILIAEDCRSVRLRKQRTGGGNGRVYTIVLQLRDASGNVAVASKQVFVPHDQGKKGAQAVDDGASHTVKSRCR
jgi:hypothetical protein